MVAHIAITILGRQRQEDYLKFEVSLAYAASQGSLKQKIETKPEVGGTHKDQLLAAGSGCPDPSMSGVPSSSVFSCVGHDRRPTELTALSSQGLHFTTVSELTLF